MSSPAGSAVGIHVGWVSGVAGTIEASDSTWECTMKHRLICLWTSHLPGQNHLQEQSESLRITSHASPPVPQGPLLAILRRRLGSFWDHSCSDISEHELSSGSWPPQPGPADHWEHCPGVCEEGEGSVSDRGRAISRRLEKLMGHMSRGRSTFVLPASRSGPLPEPCVLDPGSPVCWITRAL